MKEIKLGRDGYLDILDPTKYYLFEKIIHSGSTKFFIGIARGIYYEFVIINDPIITLGDYKLAMRFTLQGACSRILHIVPLGDGWHGRLSQFDTMDELVTYIIENRRGDI